MTAGAGTWRAGLWMNRTGRKAKSLRLAAVAMVLFGVSACSTDSSKEQLADRAAEIRNILIGKVSAATPETDIVAELVSGGVPDVRGLEAPETPRGGDSEYGAPAFYAYDEDDDTVRFSVLFSTGVIEGGFSNQTIVYYSCAVFSANQTKRDAVVDITAVDCPSETVSLLVHPLDTFIDTQELDIPPAEEIPRIHRNGGAS